MVEEDNINKLINEALAPYIGKKIDVVLKVHIKNDLMRALRSAGIYKQDKNNG